jgi:hypothetical protein
MSEDIEHNIYVDMPRKIIGTFIMIPTKQWEKIKALPEKWQHEMPVGSGLPTLSMREIYFRCINELNEELKK